MVLSAFRSARAWLAQLSPGWIVAACLLLLPLQVSNQSLWIDEGDTALYAVQPNFTAWLTHLKADKAADCQMPLGMFISWAAGKALGTAEWQLRLVNLLWSGGTLLVLFQAGRALRCKWLPAVMVLQPYFWFYNNEARPFALEVFCGSLLLLGFVGQRAEIRSQRSDFRFSIAPLAAGAVLLGYTTLLAPFTYLAVIVGGGLELWLSRRGQTCGSQHAKGVTGKRTLLWLGIATLLLLPIGAYYAYTLVHGRGLPTLWRNDWKNFLYLGYELTGLAGLGPSLLEMREAAQARLLGQLVRGHPWEIAAVALAAVCWVALLAAGVHRLVRRREWHWLACLLAVPLVGGGALTAAGLVMKKMFWARHWAPLFPFYVAGLALALQVLWQSQLSKLRGGNGSPPIKDRGRDGSSPISHCPVGATRTAPSLPLSGPSVRFWPVVCTVWLGLLLASALSFRFADRHHKDDYRSAAALAHQSLAAGCRVWWAASWHCAVYYRVPVGAVEENRTALSPECYPVEPANALPDRLPVILLSRPSIYDPAGLLRSYAQSNHMACEENLCRSFRVYGRDQLK
jgi:hypothetical protein